MESLRSCPRSRFFPAARLMIRLGGAKRPSPRLLGKGTLYSSSFRKQPWKVHRMNGESIKTRIPTATMRSISSLPTSHPSPSVNILATLTRIPKTPPSQLAAAMSGIASSVLAPVTTLPGKVIVIFPSFVRDTGTSRGPQYKYT